MTDGSKCSMTARILFSIRTSTPKSVLSLVNRCPASVTTLAPPHGRFHLMVWTQAADQLVSQHSFPADDQHFLFRILCHFSSPDANQPPPTATVPDYPRATHVRNVFQTADAPFGQSILFQSWKDGTWLKCYQPTWSDLVRCQ